MKKIALVVTVVMIAVLLCMACVGCSASDYAKQLEKKDYTTTSLSADSSKAEELALTGVALLLGAKGDIEYIVSGVKEGSAIYYVKFAETKDAKEFVDVVKSDKDYQKVNRVGGLVKVEYSKAKK